MNQMLPAKSLSDWLNWLENTRPETDIDLGLDRIRLVGSKLTLLTPAPYVITVAGTNGKGSTIALLEAIFIEAGYSVGAFTSPHFQSFNERIRINGEMVEDASLCSAFKEINQGRDSTWLTYFEFATLAAVSCFQRAGIEIALMEVGLGGRLDATNAIEPDLSVITSIGLDHQDWLGYSIDAIAREKAGIMRTGKPTVFGMKNMPGTVLEQAVKLDVPLFRRAKEFDFRESNESWCWQGVTIEGASRELNDLPIPYLVIDNAATVLQALEFFRKL